MAECRHGFNDIQWCGDCKAKPARTGQRSGYHLWAERDLPEDHKNARIFRWAPYRGESVRTIPNTATHVHIVGAWSTDQLLQLIDWCKELRVIEIAPSQIASTTINSGRISAEFGRRNISVVGRRLG